MQQVLSTFIQVPSGRQQVFVPPQDVLEPIAVQVPLLVDVVVCVVDPVPVSCIGLDKQQMGCEPSS